MSDLVSTKGKCIIFSAPSGSGKTTIVKHLLSKMPNLAFSISACSRMPRYGEQHAKDYYFLTPEAFSQKISQNAFLEWEEVYPNHYYGTLSSELDRIWKQKKVVVFDVDVVGGVRLKQKLNQHALSIFVMPPSIEILEQRLRSRATENEQIIRQRIEKANLEMQYAPKFDVQLLNDTLDHACKIAESIVQQFIES